MSAINSGQEINLAIVGAGSMGKGLLFQSRITSGMRCVAMCDTTVEKCILALEEFGISYRVAHSPGELEDAVHHGRVGVCASAHWIADLEEVEVVVEASSAIEAALEHSLLGLERGKHLVLMNSELDLMFGPLLHRKAREYGVVCTSCDGDQYGALKHLVDDLGHWGFELVMAGNIKGYLDRYANPTSIVAEADKRALDYRMCTSYTDGTKLNIEMAIAANAFDLRTLRPGMTGPQVERVGQVLTCFDLEEIWRDRQGVVDYILGAEPGGGVFAVGYCDVPYQQKMLLYYKMGSGPFYLFYRPFHLCHIEAMGTVYMAARQGRCFMGPNAGFRTNVFAYAKRDLAAGSVLDGVGGYDCYGQIENLDESRGRGGVPICLARGAVLRRAFVRDERLEGADVVIDSSRHDVEAYALALEKSNGK